MPVFDLYSKRLKCARDSGEDVYVYDAFPAKLRVQIVQILRDALGRGEWDSTGNVESAYRLIVGTLCREYGLFRLQHDRYVPRDRDFAVELETSILEEQDAEKFLDAVELSFRCVDQLVRSQGYLYRGNPDHYADSAISELNQRFLESSIGFRFEPPELIRLDSELIHKEVMKPALKLLNEPSFSGAQDEFFKAHEHYRHGRYKEALNETLKSLESTMKSICEGRKWIHKPNATANELIDVCMKNELVRPLSGNRTSLHYEACLRAECRQVGTGSVRMVRAPRLHLYLRISLRMPCTRLPRWSCFW